MRNKWLRLSPRYTFLGKIPGKLELSWDQSSIIRECTDGIPKNVYAARSLLLHSYLITRDCCCPDCVLFTQSLLYFPAFNVSFVLFNYLGGYLGGFDWLGLLRKVDGYEWSLKRVYLFRCIHNVWLLKCMYIFQLDNTSSPRKVWIKR